MKKNYIIIILILIISCINISSCTPSVDNSQNEKLTPIEVMEVSEGTINETIQVTEKLKAKEEIVIIPIAPAKVNKINIQLGDKVEKNQLLMEFDTSNVSTQVKLAQLGVEMAKLNLNSAQQAYEATKDAEENSNNSLQNQDAIQQINDLYDNRIISEEQRDVLLQQIESGSINNANNILVGLTGNPEDNLKKAELGLQQAEIQYQAALKQMNEMKIKSPINGVVTSLNVTQGNYVTQSVPPIVISNLDELLLDIGITEFQINKVKKGQKVMLTVDAVDKYYIEGKVIAVSPSPDQRTQKYKIQIEIDNSNGLLKPGMMAKGDIIIEEKKDSIVIPSNALVSHELQPIVYIVKDQSAEKRELEVGAKSNDLIEVISGLELGEVLVIKGQDFIFDGAKIEIVNNFNE